MGVGDAAEFGILESYRERYDFVRFGEGIKGIKDGAFFGAEEDIAGDFGGDLSEAFAGVTFAERVCRAAVWLYVLTSDDRVEDLEEDR